MSFQSGAPIEKTSKDSAETTTHNMAVKTSTLSQYPGINHIPDINFNINEEDFEDIDEDIEDFSEDEDFYEGIEDGKDDQNKEDNDSNDMTKQLLDFAQNVNTDIQKYFGRRKDEDSCDIYADKWMSKRSGRELYLADILRIAQGGDNGDEPKTPGKELKKAKIEHSGQLDKKQGLGPLEELFAHISHDNYSSGPKQSGFVSNKHSKIKRLDSHTTKNSSMCNRNLPKSFWMEPIKEMIESANKNLTQNQRRGLVDKDSINVQKSPVTTNGLTTPESFSGDHISESLHNRLQNPGTYGQQTPLTPDFSDLLDSWAGDEQNGRNQQNMATATAVKSNQPVIGT